MRTARLPQTRWVVIVGKNTKELFHGPVQLRHFSQRTKPLLANTIVTGILPITRKHTEPYINLRVPLIHSLVTNTLHDASSCAKPFATSIPTPRSPTHSTYASVFHAIITRQFSRPLPSFHTFLHELTT